MMATYGIMKKKCLSLQTKYDKRRITGKSGDDYGDHSEIIDLTLQTKYEYKRENDKRSTTER